MISIDHYLDQYTRDQKLPPERPQPGLSELCQVYLKPAAQCPLRDEATFEVIAAYYGAVHQLDRAADGLARQMYRDNNPVFHQKCRDIFRKHQKRFADQCRAAWSSWNNPTGKVN